MGGWPKWSRLISFISSAVDQVQRTFQVHRTSETYNQLRNLDHCLEDSTDCYEAGEAAIRPLARKTLSICSVLSTGACS
jgi:hypothetical protein